MGFRDGTSSLPVRQRRREGKLYCVSPWALSWADDNYYLIGYDSESDSVRHYRVDKMEGIAETELARDGEKAFADFDMAVYTRRVFGMFGGDEETVTLRFDNGLLGWSSTVWRERLHPGGKTSGNLSCGRGLWSARSSCPGFSALKGGRRSSRPRRWRRGSAARRGRCSVRKIPPQGNRHPLTYRAVPPERRR